MVIGDRFTVIGEEGIRAVQLLRLCGSALDGLDAETPERFRQITSVQPVLVFSFAPTSLELGLGPTHLGHIILISFAELF